MKIAIICNGEFPSSLDRITDHMDMIVACDGAASTLVKQYGMIPDYVVGDLDSLEGDLKEKLKDRIIHIPDQETNDQTKAFRFVSEFNPDTVIFIANMGKRADHTLGNLSLLMNYLEDNGIEPGKIYAASDYSYVYPAKGRISVKAPLGTSISIISSDISTSFCSEGLKYPTDGIRLTRWWQATLNENSSEAIRIIPDNEACAYLIISTSELVFQ